MAIERPRLAVAGSLGRYETLAHTPWHHDPRRNRDGVVLCPHSPHVETVDVPGQANRVLNRGVGYVPFRNADLERLQAVTGLIHANTPTEDTEGTESRDASSFCEMDALIAEPVDAPNPAIAPRFHAGRDWRGVGDPGRSAQKYVAETKI